MKKQKLRSLVKTARKAERNNISLKITSELNTIAENLTPTSKKVEKAIKKHADKLAKVISMELKINKNALLDKQAQKTSEAPSTS